MRSQCATKSQMTCRLAIRQPGTIQDRCFPLPRRSLCAESLSQLLWDKGDTLGLGIVAMVAIMIPALVGERWSEGLATASCSGARVGCTLVGRDWIGCDLVGRCCHGVAGTGDRARHGVRGLVLDHRG